MESNCKALVMGDYHCWQIDKTARKVIHEEIIPLLRPHTLVLHDFFDGISINPHEWENMVVQARRARQGWNNLYVELEHCAKELELLEKLPGVERILIVKSNHDLFLDRWIIERRYLKDRINVELGGELFTAMCGEADALETGIRKCATLSKTRFLKINDDVRIEGIQVAVHGHGYGRSPAPSLRTLGESYGAISAGHNHSIGICDQAWRVGTLEDLNPDYREGPTNWVLSVQPIYKGGFRQLLNIVNGKFRIT